MRYIMGAGRRAARLGNMERSLIWLEGEENGWSCSNCRWKYPVPTLLSGEEAMGAYDRLAAAKFRDHKCETEASFASAKNGVNPAADNSFADRAKMLIKRGYKPKVAVELVLQEIDMEFGHKPNLMDKARADAEDFLRRVSKGLI
jgi:hypothetical protein